ncbi:MAG TPA: hypothetical protein VFH83_04370, partial [Spirochaetia bacterium]|nr:hypothetical protein [Spirochaetia bacterium]
MALLLVLALALVPVGAGAQTNGTAPTRAVLGLTGIAESADLVGRVPEAGALQGAVVSLFNRSYGRSIGLAVGPITGVAGTVGLQIDAVGDAVQAITTLSAGTSARSLASTVPFDAPGALVSTITSDLAYLWFSLRSFTT